MQVQIRINEEGAWRNQRAAFPDQFTLIVEPVQDARHTGRQRIETVDVMPWQPSWLPSAEGRP